MASQLSRKIVAIPVISQIADMANVARMIDLSQKFEHYRRRFVEALVARNFTSEGLAEMIGAHPVTVAKLRSGKINLDDEWRARVAAGLKLPEEVLFGDAPLPVPRNYELYASPKKRGRPRRAGANDNIPHFGLAAGSLVGAPSMSSDLPEEVPCPPGLRDAWGAYALTTKGDSMIPRYFPGERLYVNPNQRVKTGDHVVIQVARDDGNETETWVKRYDTEDDENVWVSQYNPPTRIAFKKRYVRYLHRILPINELL